MTKRKFYRAKVTVEILSEDPIDFESGKDGDGKTHPVLDQISEAITSGHWSGCLDIKIFAPVNGKKMAKMLCAQESDPEFFQLTSEGEDADE